MFHKSKTVKEKAAVLQAIIDVYPNAVTEHHNISLRRKTIDNIVDSSAKLDSLVVVARYDAEPMIAPTSGIQVDDWLVSVERPDTRYIPIHALLRALREFEPETHAKILSTLIEMQDAAISMYTSGDPTTVGRGARYVELLKEGL